MKPGLRRAARAAGRGALWLLVVLVALELSARLAGWYLLRSRTHRLEAHLPSGGYRMLFIGESTTYGLGVEPNEAYPAQLAALLEIVHPNKRFLAFNRGVPSLTTSAMLRTLPEKLSLVSPDMVLLLVGVNDFHSQYNGVRLPGEGWLPRPLGNLLSSLRVYRFADVFLQLRKPKMGLSRGPWLDERSPAGTHLDQAELFYDLGEGHYLLYSDDPKDKALAAQCRAKLEENLRRMIQECQAAGAKVVVLGYLRAAEENAMVRAVAEETGATFVPTWTDPKDSYERPKELFQSDGFHPSAQGHRLMAERIEQGIEPLLSEPR